MTATIGSERVSAPERPEGHRVLVVEDSLLNQEVASGMLRLLGYQADLAEDGREAVEAVQRNDYDLVLMDCHMPGMDGFTATRLIREWEAEGKRTPLPIIALTADASADTGQRCQDAGMDARMGKPFTRESLRRTLDTWLHRRKPEHDSGMHTAIAEDSDPLAFAPDALEEIPFPGALGVEDPRMFGKLAALLRQEAPKLLDKLSRALHRGDLDGVRLAAHTLKSSCAHIGAAHLSERVRRMEQLAQAGSRDGLERDMPGLEADMARFMEALAGPAAWVETRPPENTAASSDGEILLMVDDDPAFRLLTAEALRREGFRVEEAANGPDALALVKQVRPDLVLMDALMEGMDGFEVCQRLKEDVRAADIPVLMVTGLEDAEAAQRAFAAGASGFTSKPLSYPILTQRIRFLLRARHNEKALLERQLQLESAQRLAHLGYWRWDTHRDVFEISQELAAMCGLESSPSLPGYESLLALVNNADRKRLELVLEKARNGDTGQPIDFHLKVVSGGRVHVQQAIELQQEGAGSQVLLGVVQDVTHIRAMENQLRNLAFYDSLTGLPNRVLFFSRLEEILSSARRHNEQVSLLFLDLDSFKDVNDSLGHDVGDQLLQEVARRLEDAIRDEDLVVRLGGDEFCILASESEDGLDAAEVASRCIARVNEPLELKHQRIRPQVSVGIARFPEDADTPMGLLKAADSAMYAAKEAGKNRYAYYRVEMTRAAEQRLALEQEIRNAIQHDEFVLHYQPQVDLDSGCCVGVEALVRWQHPEGRIVAPDDFIPMVERMGLIDALGHWVVREACQQMGRWSRAGHDKLKMAVNFSPRQLAEANLQEQLQAALDAAGLSPGQFQVEVTESAVQEGRELIKVLQDLRALGVQIAIDDFGTGYSALGSLKKLPIDTLKIDRSFVSDMLSDKHDTIVLGTIVGLAHAMQYCLVAEGAEDLDQVKVLHALGVDMVQGYYLSRPVPAEELTPLLDQDFHALRAVKGESGE